MKCGMTAIALLAAISIQIYANPVPLVLPQPDGNAGDSSKPVKVYILAGQSNMVGFGRLDAGGTPYASYFLMADPNLAPGPLSVGKSKHKMIRHGIFQAATANAAPGAKAAMYRGAYDPTVDYSTLTPVKETTVALGTVSATLPTIDGPHTLVVRAFIDVPNTGTYTLHAGFQASSYNIVTLAGNEVYRKDTGKRPVVETVQLEANTRYPITITYRNGGSATFWMQQTGLPAVGGLETITKKQKKFPWLIDANGKWTTRKDVIYWDVRTSKEAIGDGGPLSVTSNGKFIGPEVPFGYVMGTLHDEQVLLIESSMGNRALSFDFRPPSSGRNAPDSKWEGLEYRLMVEGVHKALKNLDKVIPDYNGQGYEIAGFVWWQGHKDAGKSKDEYEKHLVNLIMDLRNEFKAPKMKAVVATVGFDGWNINPDYTEIHKAQMAVGDPKQHPEFAGDVASVDTRGFWRTWEESPTGTGYHYNHNAETYVLTGDALGRAMAKLQGGDVELPPAPQPPPKKAAPTTELTDDERAAAKQVAVPIIVDGMLPAFITNRNNAKAIADAFAGKRAYPVGNRRSSQFPGDVLDAVNGYFTSVGVTDYNWHDFGPDLKDGTWEYFSFDPPEGVKDRSKGSSYRTITLPKGMETWFAPGFDSAKAGWKTGAAPFGSKGGKLAALSDGCRQEMCRCGTVPNTLWEKEVLLIRKTFDAPTLKAGHRYRIIVGGSNHVQAGDGFELYLNGKPLVKVANGVGKRQGAKPVGSLVYAENLEDLGHGKVTIAYKSFLRYNHPRVPEGYPPNGHVSIWLQEQKLPPIQ